MDRILMDKKEVIDTLQHIQTFVHDNSTVLKGSAISAAGTATVWWTNIEAGIKFYILIGTALSVTWTLFNIAKKIFKKTDETIKKL